MVDHLGGVEREACRFFATVGDLDLHVPSCPGWQVRDLVHHVGTVHRTFARVAAEGWMERPPDPDPEDRPDPSDDAVVDWARRQAERLLAALATMEPTAPRWNFSSGPQVGGFIPRRMHLETGIHRWDLEFANGICGTFADDVAADGVAEYLAVYLPRSGPWPGEPADILVRPDGWPAIIVELRPGTPAQVSEAQVRAADLVLRGPAERLLLGLWGRAALTPTVSHDRGRLVDALLAFAYR